MVEPYSYTNPNFSLDKPYQLIFPHRGLAYHRYRGYTTSFLLARIILLMANAALQADRHAIWKTGDRHEKRYSDYHEITIVMTDGSEHKTRSTWGKAGDVLSSISTQKPIQRGPASTVFLTSGGQVARFNKRFGGLGMK